MDTASAAEFESVNLGNWPEKMDFERHTSVWNKHRPHGLLTGLEMGTWVISSGNSLSPKLAHICRALQNSFQAGSLHGVRKERQIIFCAFL